MPIKIMSDDRSYPGVYDALTGWLKTFLRLELGATEPVIGLLATWMRSDEPRVCSTWAAAIDTAKEALGTGAGEFAFNKEKLPPMVRSATSIVQDAMALTGASTGHNINKYQRYMNQDGDDLLDSARHLPPSARAGLQAKDMPGLLKISGSTSTLAPWQSTIVCHLVQHPFLLRKLPTILLAGSSELRESHITRLKPKARISATCVLTAQADDITIQAMFGTNSGKSEPILMEYDYPDPVKTGQTIHASQHVTVDPVYQTFEVTADETERGPTPRLYDADKKLFDAVHDLLVRVCLEADVAMHTVTGTLAMTTEIRMCTSCYLVALQFLTNFPSLNVTINKL